MIMSIRHSKQVRIPSFVIVIAFFGPLSFADEEDKAPADDSTEIEEVEEIIVYGGRRGGPVDLSIKYEDDLRARIMKDIERLRVLEEENEWRKPDTTVVSSPSRIRWGYEPGDELRMRQNTRLADLPVYDTQPATIFSVEF